jgi:hypothetical protein
MTRQCNACRDRERAGRVPALLAAQLLLLAACGSDDSSSKDNGDDQSGDAVYAMTFHAFGPDDTDTSYLVTMSSLEEGSEMDVDSAIELPDYANVSGIPGEPFVWLSDFSTPIVERWDLQKDGSLKKGPTLSFSNLGVSSVSPWAQGTYLSLELAAVPNQETGELIFWNPKAMEIVDTLDLEIPEKNGIAPLIRSLVARPDGTLLASYYHISTEGEFADGAGIVIVDPEKNEVIARDEWEGCNYNYAKLTADGTVYLTINASWALRELIYEDGPWLAEACLLRVLPGETQFDREFDPKTLVKLAGDRPITGSFEPLSENEAFFSAWQDEVVTQKFTAENFDDVAYSTPGFKWYHWNMKTGETVEVPGEPFAGIPSINRVDGNLLFGNQDRASENGGLGVAPFYKLTPEGAEAAFTSYGTIWNILRLR